MGSNGGGFNFDLAKRNAMLEAKGASLPKAWKTGTTIAGIIFKVCPVGALSLREEGEQAGLSVSFYHMQDGVVLGADTRSTSGSTVADKNCSKIHYIAPNIYACGAGTAADLEHVTGEAPPS